MLNMRLITAILFCYFMGFCAIAKAQENSARRLLEQANELIPNNPDQAIKIGQHLLQNANSDLEECTAVFLIAQSYSTKGNDNQALHFAFRARQKAQNANLKEQSIPIAILIAEILRKLQLEQQSKYYLDSAQSDAQQNATWCDWVKGKASVQLALTQLENRKPEMALESLRKANVLFAKQPQKQRAFDTNEVGLNKAKAFTMLGLNDSALYYFNRSRLHLEKEKPINLLGQANLLAEWARLYFQQQQHQKATETLLEALPIANKLHHTELQRDINKQLAINYLALNDRNSYHIYNQKFLALSSEIENHENEATNTAFNLISREQEQKIPLEGQKFVTLLYVTTACFLLVLLFGIIQLSRNSTKQKRYNEILKYLRSNNNPPILATVVAKKQPSKNLIPTETEQLILSKLKKFETSGKFINKEMSLAMLASLLDTNTKYLSEVINKHYHDNFNTYINKLRVNYIMEKLKSEPAYLHYKISYLAEESGFSSHSSFATIFKSITGIAPTTFIDFLKEQAVNKTNS